MDIKKLAGVVATILLLGGALTGAIHGGRKTPVSAWIPLETTEDPTLADGYRPSCVESATFAMGCFWGPDALFGSIAGVLRTRVGYAGGTSAYPAYYALGDHAEAVQIDFDPNLISYGQLLEIFWIGHDPYVEPYSPQYRSLILVHDAAQRAAAEAWLSRAARQTDRAPTTEIVALDTFTRAEAYHQKHNLWMSRSVMEDLLSGFASFQAYVDSTLVARVNGLLAGWGAPELVDVLVEQLGLAEDTAHRLREAAVSDHQSGCGLLIDPALRGTDDTLTGGSPGSEQQSGASRIDS